MKMKDTLKKLIPYAFVGVISGATTFGAINYFNVHNEDADFSYFAPKNNDAKYASFNMTGVGDDFVRHEGADAGHGAADDAHWWVSPRVSAAGAA